MLSQTTLKNNGRQRVEKRESWKILLVDDDQHNHRMIRLFLRKFTFEGLPLEFVSAYSGAEAKTLIQQHPDTALIFLDMVMEELDSGLRVADFIRNDLGNTLVRIVMLTGQSQYRTEEDVITGYDINDYRLKTEFSRQKLTTTVLTSLRSYRDLITTETSRHELAELSTRLAARSAELELLNHQLKIEITRREKAEQALSHQSTKNEIDLSAATILVVDDDAISRKMLQTALSHNGYQVSTAANGEVALQQAFAQRPNLILLDIMMPNMDGFAVCECLKAGPDTRDIPIIFVSASDSVQSKIRAFAAGGVDFVTKPTSMEELLVRVSTHLMLRAAQKHLQQNNEALQAEIARRKQAQQELEEQRNLLRSVMDAIPDAIFVKDTESRFVINNVAHLHNLGVTSQSEVVGKTDFDIFPPELASAYFSDEQAVVKSGQPLLNREEPYTDPITQTKHWLSTTKVALTNSSGQIIGLVGSSRNITEQRQAEAALRQAYRQQDRLLTAIPSVLIGVNGDNIVTHWNTPAETVFAITGQAVVSRPLADCGVQWQWNRINPALARCRETDQPIDLHDVRYNRPDGKEGFLKVTITPFDDHTSLLLLAQEITQRKVLEGQLAQAQKLEAVGQLAAGIAHEINTPTQYIGNNVSFLQASLGSLQTVFNQYQRLMQAGKEGVIPPGLLAEVETLTRQVRADYLLEELPLAAQEAMDGVNRVTEIVKAMKEFSHPGIDKKMAIDINQAIKSTITVTRNEWKYVAQVETNLDASLPRVPCLPGEFNQVILNIIVNAAHAIADAGGAQQKGTITISTERQGDWVEIKIADTGAGIADDIKPRIFDPFFTTKDVGRGTGQGLAIAHAVIVEKYHGSISVESQPGQGATFIIRLPVYPKEEGSESYG